MESKLSIENVRRVEEKRVMVSATIPPFCKDWMKANNIQLSSLIVCALRELGCPEQK
jgi:hypothetical protein